MESSNSKKDVARRWMCRLVRYLVLVTASDECEGREYECKIEWVDSHQVGEIVDGWRQINCLLVEHEGKDDRQHEQVRRMV